MSLCVTNKNNAPTRRRTFSAGITHNILDLVTRQMCVQLQASAALPPGKLSQYPLDRRLVSPQCHFGRGGEEKIHLHWSCLEL